MGNLFGALGAAGVTAALVLGVTAAELALPGYRYSFPRDHFSHLAYQTEWWYYTGNLRTAAGEFGFELTFFRYSPEEQERANRPNPTWNPKEIYIGHFAVTDLAHKKFMHWERVNRAGPGLAGVDSSRALVWNGNWSAHFLSYDPLRQRLEAVMPEAHLILTITAQKPVVIHGENGVSQKGPKPGQASHYYSSTRMEASGKLSIDGRELDVTGLAWMDREFFSTTPGDPVAGWDWMCIQLDTSEELMLYRLRLKDGTISPYSSGTLVDPAGKSTFLPAADFRMQPLTQWKSPNTGAAYPIAWQLDVPSRKLTIQLTTPVETQELVNRTTRNYWEGAVRYSGLENGRGVKGVGYLEMTGY